MDIFFRKGTYYSLSAPLEWTEVPPLAVITGANGVGKSQFLRLLQETLVSGTSSTDHKSGRIVELAGLTLEPLQVVLQSGTVELRDSEVGLAEIAEQARQTLGLLRSDHSNRRFSVGDDQHFLKAVRRDAVSKTLVRQMGLSSQAPHVFAAVPDPELRTRLPAGHMMSTKPDIQTLSQELSGLFGDFHWRAMQTRLETGVTIEEAYAAQGTCPWDVLDDVLRAANLPLKCMRPPLDLFQRYRFSLTQVDGVEVWPTTLSSGEKVILGLAMWLLASGHGVLPKLILLDEPEAHLHPPLIPAFLRMLTDELVAKHGCRIIMTTHRPETLVFAPEGSLFLMRREAPRVVPVQRRRALAGLTSGVVSVALPTRCVLVEAEPDQLFYQCAMRILVEGLHLSTNIQLAFRSASIGEGAAKLAAGRTGVQKWAKKLADSGLDEFIRGLVDYDKGAMPGRSDHDRAWVRGDHVGWANEARTKSSQRPVLS